MKGDTIDVLGERIEKITESGCWIWMGACRDSGKGYGRVWANGQSLYAHRAVYELLRGPIPEGLTLDHLCKVRCCVNPSHLEIVTRIENAMRGLGPLANNARKTHCKNGHLFTEENTDIRRTKSSVGIGRRCRTCHLKYMKVWNSDHWRKR